VEHRGTDESDVAVAELPSTSGAHWANRDREAERRRGDSRSAPFRRPPAVNSFETDEVGTSDRWSAFASAATSDNPGGWFGGTGDPAGGVPAARTESKPDAPTSPPKFGPAPPASPGGRASFGVTEGPISGARPDPVSPAAPQSPAPVQPMPLAPEAGHRGGAPDETGRHGHAAAPAMSAGQSRERVPEPPSHGHHAAPARAGGPADDGTGELFSGPGREIRPHRAARGPAAEAGPHAGGRRRSKLTTAAAVALTATVLLGGAVAGVAYFGDGGTGITEMLSLGSGTTDGKVATAPLDGRNTATFELIAAPTKVTVRAGDLGEDLFKITAAGDSGTAPEPVLTDNTVQLLMSPDGDGTSGVVEVLLSSKVTWGLRFVGGADEQIIDLSGGRISSLDLAGGSRRVDLTLPKPTGTVPVKITGALEDFSVASPAGSPVRVQVDSGAKTVAAGERTLRDVEPGATLTPKNWKVPNRYDIDAASRITLLSVKTTGKAG
jgi:hypothetical protein